MVMSDNYVKIIWTYPTDNTMCGYTVFADRVFRLFYNINTCLLSVYPCDEGGAPIGLYLYGTKISNVDIVLNHVVKDLDKSSIREFLEWSFNVFADMGIIKISTGDIVDAIYSQLSEFFDPNQASVITSTIINDMIGNKASDN